MTQAWACLGKGWVRSWMGGGMGGGADNISGNARGHARATEGPEGDTAGARGSALRNMEAEARNTGAEAASAPKRKQQELAR